MNMQQLTGLELAGKSELLGENLPQCQKNVVNLNVT
jgi:hypothetical protein